MSRNACFHAVSLTKLNYAFVGSTSPKKIELLHVKLSGGKNEICSSTQLHCVPSEASLTGWGGRVKIKAHISEAILSFVTALLNCCLKEGIWFEVEIVVER